jgi:hypothetical protein
MPNFFYFDQHNQKFGPITEEQLKGLAASGLITPQTPMETDSGHKGVAGQIPGINFGTAAPSPFAQPIPKQQSPTSPSGYNYKTIASWHRLSTVSVAVFVLGNLVARGLIATSDIETGSFDIEAVPLFGTLLSLGLVIFSIICMVRLARSIYYGVGAIILFAICVPFGPIGLIPLICVYLRAGKILKQAGYQVGFHGADMRQFDNYIPPSVG